MSDNTDSPMTVVEIRKEPIELYQLLKIANLVQSGGEAKFVISEGLVRVNGFIETKKRKKIISGDVVEYNLGIFRVKLRE